MRNLRIGVPPGVGDTYWALTKVGAIRELHGKPVTLVVQQTPFERATAWASMVDFVDAVEVQPFSPRPALKDGWAQGVRGMDLLLWPNAVLDRGKRIETWMPEYELDLAFPVRTAEAPDDAVVLYVSSERMNRSRFPLPADYWPQLARSLADCFEQRVTLIGAHIDRTFADSIEWGPQVENLVGMTTLPVVAGLIRQAKVVVGVISGMTILGNHFRVPTVAICPAHYVRAFPYTWLAADAPYAVHWIENMPKPEHMAAEARALCG